MPPDDILAGIDPTARDLIRRKVRKLVGKAGFTAQDRDDLEQDLALLLLRRWPAFDPNRGAPGAFVTTVLDSGAANLLRDRLARRRRQGRVASLHQRVRRPDGEEADLGETIPQGTSHHPHRRPSEELARLAGRVGEVLDTLPPDLRELAELLKEHSMAEAARILGVPRTTLYARRHRLREWFGRAGLQDFLR